MDKDKYRECPRCENVIKGDVELCEPCEYYQDVEDWWGCAPVGIYRGGRLKYES